jgi:hypothetical protein
VGLGCPSLSFSFPALCSMLFPFGTFFTSPSFLSAWRDLYAILSHTYLRGVVWGSMVSLVSEEIVSSFSDRLNIEIS